jgi:hypothetical protein
MIRYPSAMSNAQRQAKFRAAHPGYNRKYRGPSARKVAAQVRAEFAALAAAEAAAAAAAGTALPETSSLRFTKPAPPADSGTLWFAA